MFYTQLGWTNPLLYLHANSILSLSSHSVPGLSLFQGQLELGTG